MKHVVVKKFLQDEVMLTKFISNFDSEGEDFGKQDRNSLKLFDLNGLTINVKSFKVPNIVNQIAYKFFRKSKAQRSYEYANKLIKLGIGTPQPIAYYEFTTPLLFKKSFYISEQLDCDYTYRDLTQDFNIPNYEPILRAFTRFTYKLHENNVLFLDHSPGNTLIKVNNNDYEFFLVDLNRMEFKPLDFNTRIKNFARLTIHEKMVEVMSDEYAKCIGEPYEKVFSLMWQYTNEFQYRFYRKKRLKKKLKFWKKS
ncbi:lipopolysaccharide kinase InaA family protein [Mangrovimonas spongiae]|uniref:Kdo domain containing protein n=1 Tax=Mangrovimonas spongiae TaxID=2494697 RepID=A0A428K2S3_9FLAO|nr:lipopolysaccharide kinase InaA family protein [Mangrovimonas spongiae]RSK40697.1 Kdo domain containing protein [Mangrovimonas spongiae]